MCFMFSKFSKHLGKNRELLSQSVNGGTISLELIIILDHLDTVKESLTLINSIQKISLTGMICILLVGRTIKCNSETIIVLCSNFSVTFFEMFYF